MAFDLHYLLAAEDAAANPLIVELLPFITILVVFGLTFWLLKDKVWPLILGGLDERNEKIRAEIQAAEESNQQARAALAEYEQSLAEAREEAAKMVAQARADAKATADELRARNEQEIAAMKDRATREIESAKQNAINELHAEATTLATAIAGKILEREVTTEDQQRLINESLDELSAAQPS